MNIQQFLLQISLIMPIVLDSASLFAMKREGAEIAQKGTLAVRKVSMKSDISIEKKRQDLDKIYAASMSNLKIVDTLNHIKLSNGNNVNELPVYKKLALLCPFDMQKRKFIDKIQAQKRVILLSLPADEARLHIENECQNIYEQLFDNKVNAQEQLRQAYNIDPSSEQWKKYGLEAGARAEFSFKAMQRPWNNTTYDPDVPQIFIKTLINEIQEKGFEPTAFNVEVLADKDLSMGAASCKEAQSQVIAIDSSISLAEYEKNPKKPKWHYKAIKPGCVYFNPNLAHKDDDFITHLVKHELTHVSQGDSQARSSIINAVARCAHVNPQDIMLHPAYAKIQLAQEICANTIYVLENPALVDYAIMSPDLYPESYGVLAMIKTNNEVLKKIDAQEQLNGCKDI